MHRQLGKVGTIRREVLGKACPGCGGRTYQLILRADHTAKGAAISARCSHCQRARALEQDLGRILWV